jgi:hypothetical protein
MPKIYEVKNPRNIQEHFKQYISAVYNGAKPEDLPPQQLFQIEEAFYGGWGQCLINQRDFVAAMEDEEAAADLLQKWLEDVNQKFEDHARIRGIK